VTRGLCCSAFQCVAVRCRVLQCVAERCSALQSVAVTRGLCCSALQSVSERCSVMNSYHFRHSVPTTGGVVVTVRGAGFVAASPCMLRCRFVPINVSCPTFCIIPRFWIWRSVCLFKHCGGFAVDLHLWFSRAIRLFVFLIWFLGFWRKRFKRKRTEKYELVLTIRVTRFLP